MLAGLPPTWFQSSCEEEPIEGGVLEAEVREVGQTHLTETRIKEASGAEVRKTTPSVVLLGRSSLRLERKVFLAEAVRALRVNDLLTCCLRVLQWYSSTSIGTACLFAWRCFQSWERSRMCVCPSLPQTGTVKSSTFQYVKGDSSSIGREARHCLV